MGGRENPTLCRSVASTDNGLFLLAQEPVFLLVGIVVPVNTRAVAALSLSLHTLLVILAVSALPCNMETLRSENYLTGWLLLVPLIVRLL